jgi:hypothetical protein
LETIKRTAFRRCLFLFLGVFLGLSLAVYEVIRGDLPTRGFGGVILLLLVAFLAGTSLILRTAARQTREHLGAVRAATIRVDAEAETSPGTEAALSGIPGE